MRQGIDVLPPGAARLHDLRVRELDHALALRGDREHAQLEPAAALPVEQRRIAPRTVDPDDLVLVARDLDLRRGLVDHALPDLRAALLVDERAIDEAAV